MNGKTATDILYKLLKVIYLKIVLDLEPRKLWFYSLPFTNFLFHAVYSLIQGGHTIPVTLYISKGL